MSGPGARPRYEAYCDHCKAGVLSRDSLISTGHERLCPRCSIARDEMLVRVRRISGYLLLGAVVIGGAVGYFAAGGGPRGYAGLFGGCVLGCVVANLIEGRLKRF